MKFFRRPKPVKAISFDLDDTLYDNVPVMLNAEQQVQAFIQQRYPSLRDWRIEDWRALRLEVMQRYPELATNMTELRLKTLAIGLEKSGEQQIETHAQRIMEEFLRHRNAVTISAETHQLLTRLKQRYPLFALSNGNVNVDEIGLADYFSAVIQPSVSIRGKPHEDMFKLAQSYLPDIPASAWLHVGDHPVSDVVGAQRAGWQTAWFNDGLGRPEHLRVLPTIELSRVTDLLDIL
ncbi:phosphoesterase [Idiomarina tyrosinivorans]|uniref:Phosphoesterase n=1 Tax=Idiomarina tyrosinivorans TaxID=1445662 RepID=A0A432ZPY4_9GAMM|nr:HAD-IA family hydrolase [Idiomarina tyrosinivorans]RUO79886.1 phosphoesterase [Idiomarina tyrosinivorans]